MEESPQKISSMAHEIIVLRGENERLRSDAEQLGREKFIAIISSVRIDAENPDRDKLEGIKMLRTWLRGLHMKFVEGWDQDSSQDHIAKLLGEHPREHPRFAKVDPEVK